MQFNNISLKFDILYHNMTVILTMSGQIPLSENGIFSCGTINPHTLLTNISINITLHTIIKGNKYYTTA